MARVLVTYGWSRIAWHVLRSLARDGHEVFACSSQSPAMAGVSRFCTGSFITADPFADGRKFVTDVAEICSRHRIDIVFPCHEDALSLRLHESALPDSVRLACPSLEDIQRCIDKAEMTQLAGSAGLDIPHSIFPESPAELLAGIENWRYPVVLKLRRANSGKGVYIEHSQAAVLDRLGSTLQPYFDRKSRKPYAQHFVAGEVLGAGFLAIEGRMVAFYGERYARTKNAGIGTSTYRLPCDSGDLRSATARMVAALDWTGIGHLDFIEDRQSGTLRFLEVNPRPWGGIHHAVGNGHDFPAAMVALLEQRQNLESYFPGESADIRPRASLWLLGDLIRTVHLVKEGRIPEALRSPFSTLGAMVTARVDDFSWRDPLPFLAQCWCYGRQFIRSGGSTNPDAAGMTD